MKALLLVLPILAIILPAPTDACCPRSLSPNDPYARAFVAIGCVMERSPEEGDEDNDEGTMNGAPEEDPMEDRYLQSQIGSLDST